MFMRNLLSFLGIFLLTASFALAGDLRFAQVTDVRYSKLDKDNALSKVITDINKQKNIEFVIFTGDNIQKVNPEYLEDFIKEAKKLNMPFYVVIGDKDVNKHKDLSKKEFAKILKKRLPNYRHSDVNYIFEKKGVVFFVVDGSKDVIPGTNGYFKENVVEWVDANLDLYPKKNVIIFQHFPLIPPAKNENYMTFKPEKYLQVLEKHNNVKAVISGHFGVNNEETVNGILHMSTAPSPSYRIIDIIDCTSSNPTIWAEVKEVQ